MHADGDSLNELRGNPIGRAFIVLSHWAQSLGSPRRVPGLK
jgi:hypothetical protein